MKKSILYLAFAALTVFAACNQEETYSSSDKSIKFNVNASSVETKSGYAKASVVDVEEIDLQGTTLYLTTTVSENTINPFVSDFQTKGDAVADVNTLESAKSFGMFADSEAGSLEGVAALQDDGYWHYMVGGAQQYWDTDVTGTATFWSYYNCDPSRSPNGGLSLTGVTNGTDVLFAKSTATKSENGDFDVHFYHALAAIRVVNGAGESVTIDKINIKNVATSGDVTFSDGFGGFSWNNVKGTGELEQAYEKNNFLVVPQSLTGKLLSITVTVGGTQHVLTHSFDGVSYQWTSGMLYTYTITDANGKINIEVAENDEATVSNVGSTAVYVRAAVVANWVNPAGHIVPGWNNNIDLASGWVDGKDGYYYHTTPMISFDEADLINAITVGNKPNDDFTLQVSVAFQAVEYDSKKEAATAAWGAAAASNLGSIN